MYSRHKNQFNYDIYIDEFNIDAVDGVKLFNFTKRHIDFIKTFNIN